MTEAFRVVALTGLPSSGKGEAARALIALAQRRGWQAAQLTFSDQIKEEARRRGIAQGQFNRDLLSRIGVEMRQAEGPGVLAARIAARIKAWTGPAPVLFVADGLRHLGEYETLLSEFADRLTLAAVLADPRQIARRLIARQRPDESRQALLSEDHAVRLLESELNGQLSPLGPNVGPCLARADIQLPNDGTLEELQRTVESAFAHLFD